MSQKLKDTMQVLAVPINKEGYKFIMIFGFAAILLALVNDILGVIGLVATLWCIYFFRDPRRITPESENLVISPADGVISSVEKNATPPAELGFKNGDWQKISIFLNVFNVHVNRVPADGKVTKVIYREGQFLSANDEESSKENERNSVVMEAKNKQEIIFVQIAGLIARRIVSELTAEQEVSAGERYGIIRFGSRADIYLPKNAEVKVLRGQTMIGGETVLAQLGKKAAAKITKTADKKEATKTKDSKAADKK